MILYMYACIRLFKVRVTRVGLAVTTRNSLYSPWKWWWINENDWSSQFTSQLVLKGETKQPHLQGIASSACQIVCQGCLYCIHVDHTPLSGPAEWLAKLSFKAGQSGQVSEEERDFACVMCRFWSRAPRRYPLQAEECVEVCKVQRVASWGSAW